MQKIISNAIFVLLFVKDLDIQVHRMFHEEHLKVLFVD